MMRLKPSDLNTTMPPMRKAQLIAEVNTALEALDRLDDQIRIWDMKDVSDIHIKVMQDELEFIKRGRI